jgi:hypothetical protein
MRLPAISATIRRRILVNYRVPPEALAAMLPAPFRPHLVDGHGIAGICLIRLGQVRPAGFPPALGITTENAAHRMAVEWDTPEGPVTGVYIPRRHSSSRLTVLVGGRAFPGRHDLACFHVSEGDGSYAVEMSSSDLAVRMAAHRAGTPMPGSIFATIDQASAFFRDAPVGFSATPARGIYDGVELTTDGWAMTPLHIDEVRSTMFDDIGVPDSAFLMAGLTTTWCPLPQLVATP